MNWRKLLLKNKKLLVLVDQALFSLVNFIYTVALARLLSVSDFGLYASVILILYLIISLSNAFVIQPFQVSYANIRSKNYINFSFYFQLMLCILVMIVLLMLFEVENLDLRLFDNYKYEIIILTGGLLLLDYFRKTFLAIDRAYKALLLDAIVAIIQIVGLVILVILSRINLSTILLVTAFAYVGGVVVAVVITRPVFSNKTEWIIYFRNHLTQGRWLFFTAIIQWFSGNLLVVASGIFLGPIALGAFRLVQSLFGVLNVLLQSFENYVLPQAVKLYRVSTIASKKFIFDISLKSAFVFGLVLLVLFLFASSIIELVGGEKYIPYAFVIKGMTLLYVLIFLSYPIRMAVRMLVLNNVIFLGYVFTFIFSMLTFTYLLREWQLWGVLAGLIFNQIILISFWQYSLVRNQFILWK